MAADKIYTAYPKKVGKADALKAIEKALRIRTFEFLMEATQAYAAARTGQDPQFTPHPASWFNAGHYDDDRTAWAQSGNQKSNGAKIQEIQEDLIPPSL